MSQQQLALMANVSERHLSFLETGRSRPGVDIVEAISDALQLRLRDRNELYTSAGLPPPFPMARLRTS